MNPDGTKRLFLAGHSLGSALAMLTAALLQSDTSESFTVDGVYSFGGPRVGDASWATVYNTLGLDQKTLRFVYYKDPVPMVPPASSGYAHVGRSIIFPLGESLHSHLHLVLGIGGHM